MRKVLRSVFKAYMHDTLLKTRDILDLNQDEMAYSLYMSTRAYAALEAGSSCCGLSLLLSLFLYTARTEQTFSPAYLMLSMRR